MPSKRLSVKTLDAAVKRGAIVELADGGNGLSVRVGPRGASFVTKSPRGADGKRRTIHIGRWSESGEDGLTLAAARAAVENFKATGHPEVVENAPKTVGQLAARWLADYSEKNCKSHPLIKWRVEKEIIGRIGHVRLNGVTAHRLADPVRAAVKRGSASVGQAILSDLKSIFTWAMAQGLVTENVTVSLKARYLGIKSKVRERLLSDDEIRILWTAFESLAAPMHADVSVFFRLVFLLGPRVSALAQAKKSEFRWTDAPSPAVGVWTVPAERMKGRKGATKDFQIPLPVEAAALIREMIEKYPDSSWLFPSPKSSDQGCLDADTASHVSRTLQEWPATKSVQDWTPHDARRAIATWAAEVLEDGRPRFADEVSKAIIQHKVAVGVERHYRVGQLLSIRAKALDEWSLHVHGLLGRTRTESAPRVVVPLATVRASR